MPSLTFLRDIEARTSDGSGNNLQSPQWGASGAALINLADPSYGDGHGAPNAGPNARVVSNAVLAQDNPVPSTAANADLFTFFGQFIDHDTDLTPAGTHEVLAVAVPEGDGTFAPGSQIMLGRSAPIDGTGVTGPRQYANEITAFLDASNIYGSSAATTQVLRANDGEGGKTALLMTGGDGGLPTLAEVRAANPGADLTHIVDNPNASDDVFIAGDIRVNENAALTSLHTVWVREHNFQVARLRAEHGDWSEDELFDAARVIVEAEYQRVIYAEYLPQLLGAENIPEYAGYDPTVDASISNEFSTAAFRLGHSQLSSTLQRLTADGNETADGHLNLFEAFFNPSNLQSEDDLTSLLRGLASGSGQEIDTLIVDDVRNLLFGAGGTGSDLGVLNIMRGRDHGLASLNDTREALGLARHESFADLTDVPALQAAFASVYATVDDVELWVGGLAETTVPGSQLGATFHTIVLDQFMRLRDGDRFYYEHRLADQPALLAEIEATRFSDILKRTSDVEILQDDVFVAHTRIGGTDGNDVLLGDDAHDLLIGFDGDDRLRGRDGDDDLYGGAGDDRLFGEAGRDVLDGGAGFDRLVGGRGDDTLRGGLDDDELRGGGGHDTLLGGDGDDFLHGGGGRDRVDGGLGDDELFGGGGRDTFVFGLDHGFDTIQDFDVARDQLDLSAFGFTDRAAVLDVSFAASSGVVVMTAAAPGSAGRVA